MSREQDLEYEQRSGGTCVRNPNEGGVQTLPQVHFCLLCPTCSLLIPLPILPMPQSLLAAGPAWHSHCHCRALTEQLMCAARFKAPLEALVFPQVSNEQAAEKYDDVFRC